MIFNRSDKLSFRKFFFAYLASLTLAVSLSAEAPKLSGRLETIDNVRVLTLWGSDYDRGFAHGYLLGEETVAFFGQAVLHPKIIESQSAYEQEILKKIVPSMKFDSQYEKELEGLMAGLTEKLGEKRLFCRELNRNITLQDLKALNTLPDWYSFYCSSFSVWGQLHDQKQIATARNLDFHNIPGVVESQLIIVHQPQERERMAWVSVAWGGLIGCYTGMNREGVTITMHDCMAGNRSTQRGFVPRSLALRDAIEAARSATALEDVEKILRERPSFFGNNIHVSCPYTGDNTPAAVFEYDGNGRIDGGVTRRTSANNSNHLNNQSIVCTNHHRLRSSPMPCDRYQKIEQWLIEIQSRKESVNLTNAMDMLHQVANWGNVITPHSVYMLPNSREIYVYFMPISKDKSAASAIHHFTLDQLLKSH